VSASAGDYQDECRAKPACKACHDALADHAIAVWPRGEWDQPAVLCGACGMELSKSSIWRAQISMKAAQDWWLS
jgi:uncharacterized CHY-type Zn-finger protein